MSLNLDVHQRTMLEHMGLRLDFLPPLSPQSDASPSQADATPTMAHEAKVVSAQPASAPRAPPTLPMATPAAAPPAMLGARPEVSDADWDALQAAVQGCSACGLCQTRKQTVLGVGATPGTCTVDVMIVGEAPGEQEDLQGEPFVGAAGQLLDQMLAALGLARRSAEASAGRVYIANVLKCRPPGNRNPQPEEVAQCLPYLQRQIELVQPKVLLAMGKFGAQALLSASLPEAESTPLGKLRGQMYRHGQTPLVVTYHPAYLLRTPADKAKAWADLCLAHSLVAPT